MTARDAANTSGRPITMDGGRPFFWSLLSQAYLTAVGSLKLNILATIPISLKDGQGQLFRRGLQKVLKVLGDRRVRDAIADQSPNHEPGTEDGDHKETAVHGTYLILVQGTDVRTRLCLVRFAH
jgi:hypothetical protein